MMTIAVPVSEAAPRAALQEVSAGAGGLLLFGASAPSNLTSRLASLETHVPGRISLLVMTDEEGGGVQWMANLAGSLPWPAWMGANWSTAQIQAAVTRVARKMSANGVNMDLAPVVDVDGTNAPPSATNPDAWRSFSGSTAVVTRDGFAFMIGLRSGNVIPVLKHLPGWAARAGTPTTVRHRHCRVRHCSGSRFLHSPRRSMPVLRRSWFLTQPSRASRSYRRASRPPSWPNSGRPSGSMVFGLPATTAATVSQTSAIRSAIVSAVAKGTLARSRLIAAVDAVLAARHVNLCG